MFKKIIYLSFAIFLIMFMWTVNSTTNKISSNARVQVFLYSNSSNCEIITEKGINFFKKGECYQIENEEDIQKIIEFYDAKIKLIEKIEEGTNIYAYSKNLKYSEKIGGEIINLHIFIGKNKTIIGTPFIYGSY